MTNSIELNKLIAERGEAPALIGTGHGADSPELYRFTDGTEVITTNGNLVTENDDGFASLRASILS